MLFINCAYRSALASSIAVLLAFTLGGCATTWNPIPITPRVALSPTKGDVTMQARPGAPIGRIVPVDVSIANGTDEPYLVEPDQVFAINEQGQRIMPISASEAIQEAGNANALKAGLTGAAKNAAIGAVVGAATGAAIGAAVGTIVLSPAQGALVGAAIGGSVGAAGCRVRPRLIAMLRLKSPRCPCRLVRLTQTIRSMAMCFFPRASTPRFR